MVIINNVFLLVFKFFIQSDEFIKGYFYGFLRFINTFT